MNNYLFKEEQKLRHNLLWTSILLIPLAAMLSLLCYQLITGVTVGTENQVSNLSLSILVICYGIPACLIILYVKLSTFITNEKISYGWNVPTSDLNEVRIEEIKTCEVIRYKFVGWGYRLSRLYGTVHNVDGNMGLQIITKSGSKILIGTHHADELKKAIEKLKLLGS
jgi:hypothetical protein